ncbi:hypothetical protein FJZ31_07805 [Candidatus Poribacteria bacterium]|nr:hypothetical protein [Candidatus Poribacteria bacterium]
MDKDVVNRTIVSRLYYAAHHSAKFLLKLRGYDTDSWRIDVHQRVITEIENEFVNTGLMSWTTLTWLTTLKVKRQKADYALGIMFHEPEVDKVFRLCAQFIAECKRIQGVV